MTSLPKWRNTLTMEKLEENPNYFFKETAFLRVFLDFLKKDEEDDAMDDVPESLD